MIRNAAEAPPAGNPEGPLVRIAGVSKTFGSGAGTVTALGNVSLDIGRNEFFTLLGPSGCGKTTLLRLLAGFEHPTTGEIRLDGVDVVSLPPHRRPINTVFQSYALFPHMTVAENVGFGLARLGRPADEIRRRVATVLGLVRMDTFANRRPAQLSGGQQQRVALARALAPAPRLLLLDEPLSALDLKLRREMQGELKRLQRETGVTFVLVTHDQEEALAMSDRIAVMRSGAVLQVGGPEEIYARPRTRFVADFIGEANLIPAALAATGGSGVVAVRPERVRLSTGGPGLAGTLRAVTFLGSDVLYEMTLADGTPVKARLRDPVAGLEVGGPVTVTWDAHAARAVEDDAVAS
ncbi:spermidine/putrescine transport system ATP-binding protein [Pseudoxanthobacter soli DSM 19599]|uniref:Spermidine/putrescine transport system ATP-binding protein n=1 Tax=Pseudoxanthobacter soli DSM 19599 TaxID=1123029 RepID=A0A1M7ZR52_9HYPH|nr:spermidine/putrescine transport system ATP-binding protein [Pseudoxanthobacter soli DSM 19599]